MKTKFKKIISSMLVIAMLLAVLSGCANNASNEVSDNSNNSNSNSTEPKIGGEITVAFQSAPDNFDPDHASSDWVVTAVTNHVYEGLFEFNANNEAIPQLAESYTIIDDGKTYNIVLRKGVKFQDGDEMKAEDIKSSLARWFKVNPAGVSIADSLIDIEIVNDYEILVKFDKVYAPFINILASPVSRQKMLVKKKEIVDKFGEDIITEHIGTGPFIFDEIVMGQKVVLKKNENYIPTKGDISGLAGERTVYLDKVTIEFVPEESVRVAGLKSGQFDFVDEISTDRYSELDSYPNISPTACNFGTIGIVAFNNGSEPFNNKLLRQAVAYAINPTEMAIAQIGDERFWSVEDGSWFKKGTIWYDETAGEGIYNNQDLDKARQLVKESGYNNEPIVILGVKADLFASNGALVLQNQLKEIGLNVEVELYDRSTYFDYQQSGKWNIVISRWSDMNPDPQVFEPWTGTDGWITRWDDEDSRRMDKIFDRMVTELDYEKRYEIVKEFYDEFWESVPYIKVFNDKRLYGINNRLQGYQGYGQPYFWNVWIDEEVQE
ncbi:MAG: ABC transporter substrate-binding protein [Tissierellia bacterium]|nr:ABC transporter substrate-binding protein [Tissierellia bacterium]